MPDRLYWTTVTNPLKEALTIFMTTPLFQPFRLVGGTSLSLQLGHRISVDIDLFTDATYGTIDFDAIDTFLSKNFPYVSTTLPMGPIGTGKSYMIGQSDNDAIKLDLYYTDPFIQPVLTKDIYRLATIEEIIAMKIDVVQRSGRKKDFWDIHELLSTYSPTQMIALHKQRYPYTHDEQKIRSNFVDFTFADDDLDPICLQGKYWELIKLDIFRALETEK